MATKRKLRQEQEAGMDVHVHRMTAAHARIARKLGGGNESEGVRLALERADQDAPAERRKGPAERRKWKA